MNPIAEPDVVFEVEVQAAVDRACEHIAPTWPLDRMIAVNPYWGLRGMPIAQAAARLATWSGSPMLMPRAWYREQWLQGRLRRRHLQAAIDEAGAAIGVDELIDSLAAEPASPARLPLATDLVDAGRDLGHALAWRDYVTHHVSQCCAAYFDTDQAAWGPDRSGGLYPSWRRQSAHDFAPAMLMGERDFPVRLAALPAAPRELIAAATRALRIPPAAQADYFTALLMSLNGWASWCAGQRWQARLAQQDDEQIVHLLAVRLAWEWLLMQGHPEAAVADGLARAWARPDEDAARAASAQASDWLWQVALERSHQETWCSGLASTFRASPAAADAALPAVQAVFCIDVRSEPYRRALEACSPAIRTLGFAGFFGLPIAYRPLGTEMVRPQLPGLLAPAACVTEVCDSPSLGEVLAQRRRRQLGWRAQWQGFRTGAGSSFSFVESCGLLALGSLLKARFASSPAATLVEQTGLPESRLDTLRPRLTPQVLPLAALCDTAAGVLRAMGLAGSAGGAAGPALARLVLLAGHGSRSTNNPHAAGLDCGACGGQTGEVNGRALAMLLNDREVRDGLQQRGISVPAHTVFVAGLHDTTTDEVQLYDTDLLPAGHEDDVAALRGWLAEAGVRARAARAASLGLSAVAAAGDAVELRDALVRRSADWSELRPEWGLADCGAFIVAPRERSRTLDLGGRSFLHDYDWHRDGDFQVLQGILTAPMVVTNWINLQYHASTVDPLRYGSGDKTLHNVVGGHLGVFEGNGGDLRIGLPLQSVHDGERFRHTPLRLSVFVQAPQAAIERIVAGHEVVRQLLDHGWLTMFRLDEAGGVWRRSPGGSWSPWRPPAEDAA